MKLREYRNQFAEALSALYDADEALSIFYRLLDARQNLSRIDLATNPNLELDDADRWQADLGRLQSGEPIQYIIGKTDFYGLEFEVTPSVLIPRPETEELVDWILKSQADAKSVIDICTGSGCIAIALAKNLKADVQAIDVSAEALEVATRNALTNKVEVDFSQIDVLAGISIESKFDVIVSNPPYVRELEKAEIRQNVLQHEPHLALFVKDDDALLFYREIANWAKDHLTQNGRLYFEINQYLGSQTLELLREIGFQNVELRKDLYGNDRMICCYS